MSETSPEETHSSKIIKDTTINAGDNSPVTIIQAGTVNYVAPPVPAPVLAPVLPGSLPSGSTLPFPRNALFTGREQVLEHLSVALCDPLSPSPSPLPPFRPQVISGMGGLGKSQLAVEFAYRFGYRFKGVHWLNLEDPASFSSEIAKNGTRLGLANWPDKLPDQVALTLQTWQAQAPRLVILDNLEDLSQASSLLAVLQPYGLRLLLTSRRSDWPRALGIKLLPLGTFTPQESLVLLRQYLPDSPAPLAGEEPGEIGEKANLDLLAGRLGHLPLALDLAGRYLEKHPRLTISSYLEQLAQALEHASMLNWRPDLPNLTGHDLDLLRTFALSWEQVQDEASQNLFRTAGYLAPNTAIPLEIFQAALGTSPEACDESLALLNGLGLLRLLEDGLPAIHPLLAEYARQLCSQDTAWLASLATALSQLAGAANERLVQTGKLEYFEPLQMHLAAVAGYAEKANLQAAASLYGNLGYYLQKIAAFQEARLVDEKALRLDEAALGPDHPTVAMDLNNLGTLLQALGDLTAARAIFERALTIEETALGPDHPDVAIDLNNLGMNLQALGDLPAAKDLYERALRIAEAALGADHPTVANYLNNLGTLLQAQGDLPAARAHLERALRIDEAALGADHPTVAIRLNNLGTLLQDMGDLPTARAYLERSLPITEAALGPDHPDVAIRLNNLGRVLQDLGDLPAVKALYERALRIAEAALGPDHPDIAQSLNNLGTLLQDMGDLPAARDCLERALHILRQSLPEDHPNLLTVAANLDSVLSQMEQP